MKTIFARLSLTCLLILSVVSGARAEDLNAVRSRMEQRIAQLDTLKTSGAIGENNLGMVEVRDESSDAVNVVADENRDREIVYTALANRTGASADQIGRARARQIANGSAPGVWLQDESGRWYRK